MIAIELFFLVNFLMDYYILYLSLKWLDVIVISVKRLIVASVVGSVYACAAVGFFKWLLLPPIPFLAPVPLVWISIGNRPIRVIAKGSMFALAAAFISAGTVYAIDKILPNAPLELMLVISIPTIYVAALLLGRNKKRAAWVKGEVFYKFGDIQGRFDAAIDSGNHALDPATGLPVIVVNASIVARQFGRPESELRATSMKLPLGFRLMALKTVAGTGLATLFTPDIVLFDGNVVRAAITLSPSGNLPLALAPSCFGEKTDLLGKRASG